MGSSAIEGVPATGGGGGAVSSVNTRTGAVVLTAADVGAGQLPAGVLLDSGIIIPSGADISGILGTSGSKAAAGNDSRLSDARTPTAHKTSHEPGGSDALTLLDNSSIKAAAGIALSKLATDPLARANHTGTQTVSTLSDYAASDPAAGTAGLRTLGLTGNKAMPGTATLLQVAPGGGNAGDRLSIANGLPAWLKPTGASLMRSGALAETVSRTASVIQNVASSLTTSIVRMQALELVQGMVISNITFLSGTTPGSAMTHQYFFLADSTRVQLATTADDTSTAWGASAEKTLAIATIASGAAGSFTILTTGLYYIGLCVTGTVPTLSGNGQNGNVANGLAPILGGTSDTISTGPPAFAKTYGAVSADGKNVYGWVS